MIQITVSGTEIYGKLETKLTSGTVGRVVNFTFDEKWNGLSKTAVFRVGEDCRSQYLGDNNSCEFPWELLTHDKIGQIIHIGICGMRDTEIVYPTIYTYIGELAEGANVNADPSIEHSPELVEQLIKVAEDSQKIAQSVRDDADAGKFKGEPGPKGDPGAIKFVIVAELPEVGKEDTIYLLPVELEQEHNIYEEYIYTNGDWEKIGSASVEVNLTDYVKKTDYATTTQGGVIKLNNLYFTLATNGALLPQTANKAAVENRTYYRVLACDQVDNIIKVGLTTNTETLTDEEKASAQSWLGMENYVKFNDIASGDKAGVVKLKGSEGIWLNGDILTINQATNSNIDSRANKRPITSSNLDYAVKVGLTTNTQTLTDDEKSAAQSWLGITDLVGDIETLLGGI